MSEVDTAARPAHLGVVRPPRELKHAGLFKPGHAKVGGRRKGTVSSDRNVTIKRIMRTADPIGFLCKVMNGEPMEALPDAHAAEPVRLWPTMTDRLFAARVLADKVLPDLKSTQFEGEGAPVVVNLTLAQGVKVSTGGSE